MRFIGNKELITPEIYKLLEKKGLLNRQLKLFDAFCGTGSVSDALKGSFDIVANDILKWCVVYTRGRLLANECNFEKLGFDPFHHLNSNSNSIKGFFFNSYSPGGSERMYFSPENGARIDYFRITIEEWKDSKLITENEYFYLLSSLIESVSFVSNTAGVYGAFLKHWDPRAEKPITFRTVESSENSHYDLHFLNEKIEEIILDVECDILYIDPPYTQNQYGTQYHLLETLVLYDNPSISPITGSRSTAPMRSDWSKDLKSHILFDRLLSKTKAKYIVFSYSQDGFLSKSFIEASLKRYGKPDTYLCKKISYKKYKNFKSRGKKNHFEYLFFVEKKNEKDVKYESPLNYIGSKSRMIVELKEYLPENFDTFIDAFGGGFNVGININSNRIVYNDINYFVRDLVESFRVNDTYQYLLYIKRIIKKYGLEVSDSESYLKVRDYYNSLPFDKRDSRLLYTIILYGYNQQIRFNNDHNFNNPVGMRWFNDKVLEKMISFSRIIKEKEIDFKSKDFYELFNEIEPDTFTYMDPPYRLTTGAYNDGKRGFNGWNAASEKELFDFADKLNNNGRQFMLSYVLEHKGKFNNRLDSWIKEKGYKLVHLGPIPGIKRKEILVMNFE